VKGEQAAVTSTADGTVVKPICQPAEIDSAPNRHEPAALPEIGLASPIQWMISRFAQLADAWFELGASRAIVILLFLFVVIWTGFQVLSSITTNLQPDFVEMYAWSRHPALGYYKHPPLGAFITAIWFAIFPAKDWAFLLLAVLNAAAALFMVDLIARRYLTADKRIAVILLLLLTPFYQFRAVPFGANQTLLATWPAAVYCFLRAVETRRPGWGAAAGVAAALAMLGKYYSIFLIAGLIAAALTHPQRRAYLRSCSPWISTAVGLALLAPHLLWLVTTGYLPVHYALSVHAATSATALLLQIMMYPAGAIAYVSVLLAAYFIAVQPRVATLQQALWPLNPEHRMLAVLLWVPLIAPIPVAIAAGALLSSLWTMPAWFLLPILLLIPQDSVLRRRHGIGFAAAVAATTLIAIVAAPGIAWVRFVGGGGPRLYFRLAADAASAQFKSKTGKSLSIVTGDMDLANGTTFYGESHPDALPFFDLKAAPWVTPARLAAEGWVALCKIGDQYCVNSAAEFVRGRSDTLRTALHLTPRAFGVSGPASDFMMLVVPASRSPPD